jgi:acetolactate synthase-1/2/3 large subunit
MKVSDYIINFLAFNKITHVFEVAGGSIAHLLDSAYNQKKISFISVHHEQSAAFAAEGWARSNGKIGVALATSGPGATNLITGIGSCYFDSVPSLFITGQVNTYEFKYSNKVRQAGFQETDIVNIVRPIVKRATLIKTPKMVRFYLEEAVYLAKNGRPGPVLLDIPMNIQRAEIKPDFLKKYSPPKKNTYPSKKIKVVVKLLKLAKRPVILAGHGVRLSGAEEQLKKIAKKLNIPVVSTLLGKDCFPNDNPLYFGMIGTYGNRFANLTIANADLCLILGARLDTRQTGTRPATFAREAKIIHVDIDRHELNYKVKAAVTFCADLKEFLRDLNNSFPDKVALGCDEWIARANYYKSRYNKVLKRSDGVIDPSRFMEELSKQLPSEAVVAVDVGQHQMWAAQSLSIKAGQRFITQGGMGAMGSALSMAIGAAFASPTKTIIVITGDGGFQLNTQELQTVYQNGLNIKIVLLNNHCYGMVRQFQEQYFYSRFQSTVVGYNVPDFKQVVSAYGVKAIKVNKAKLVKQSIKRLFDTPGPIFLEVEIAGKEKVEPKLSVNRPIEDSDPLLPRQELKAIMIVKPLSERG